MTTEAPLIYTTMGNVPEADLTFEPFWEYVPDSHVKFTQVWKNSSGIVVKSSSHVLALRGVTGEPVVGGVGG
jgi:hypothetical protein